MAAASHTQAPPADRTGEFLLREGLITDDQLRLAARDAREHSTRLGYSLVKLGAISESDLTRSLAKQYRVPAVDLDRVQIDPKLVKLFPNDLALKHNVLPIRRIGRMLTIAMADPTDAGAIDTIKFVTRCDIEPVIVGEVTLRRHLEQFYAGKEDDRLAELLAEFEVGDDVELIEDAEEEISAAALQAQVDDAPVVKLVSGLLTDAVQRGASDIHIEPYEHELRVRYRIDGALKEIMKPPYKMKAAIASRVKILSALNIAERRVPQDGRIKLKMKNRVVDFRVSTLPVIFGEKIVLRILDQGNLTFDLEKFGMEPKALRDFMKAIMNPYGMVLVTGPTGSGKTTTLYSALQKINTEDVNIMTAEDPVEYNLHGINQVLVRNEIGMTFAAALRAFLRQDPNIIMVGEIRDIETGGIAIKAALTGHLVLSTLHTNDAPSTITRLIDMGLEPFNVAGALNCVTAQRLVRRICNNCKQEHRYEPEYFEAAHIRGEDAAKTFYKGKGCDACGGSGYKGRAGLYEVMAISPEIRRLIMHGASTDELRDRGLQEGMLTLRMDGLLKAARGATTLEEVIKETAAT
ncbi:MAG: type IV-A pilus assembly ATPase PilB [Longimicrobiales bacterium]